MGKFSIGPPAGAFPLGSLFLIIIMVASFYSMALAGLFNPFLRNLAFGALAAMLVFALFGKWLQSYGGVGQLAFIVIGVLAIIFTDQLSGLLNLHLSLVQLSWSPPQVSLTVNGGDVTWVLWIGLVVTLYLARNDILRWAHAEF
jgi:hypothetical protein